jgi:hypothetical protein
MSIFEKVTDVGLEIPTDTEIDKMIEELENEKERRGILNKMNAVDEILEVLRKNAKPLELAWITFRDGTDFNLDELINAFETYRMRL